VLKSCRNTGVPRHSIQSVHSLHAELAAERLEELALAAFDSDGDDGDDSGYEVRKIILVEEEGVNGYFGEMHEAETMERISLVAWRTSNVVLS